MGRQGRRKLVAGVLLAAIATGLRADVPTLDAGPLVARDQTLETHDRLCLAGPFIEHQQAADGRTFRAFRPFYSQINDAGSAVSRTDVAWPIATFRRTPQETSWRVLTAFGRSPARTDETNSWRAVIFPVAAAGRTGDGVGYMALFPLAGDVHDFTIFDRFTFFLWPLYHRLEAGETVSHAVLWPIFARTQGPGIDRLRVFPFYARASNARRKSRAHFVLWPLWSDRQEDGPDGQQSGWILFPVAGHARGPDYRSLSLVPPFFRHQRNGEHRLLHAPWPFVQWGSTPEARIRYLWPLVGRRSSDTASAGFFLWPVVRWSTHDARHGQSKRRQVLPIFHHYTRRRPGTPEDAPADVRRTELWPLFSYEREGETARTRLLDLWPGKQPPAIERNLAPLLALYERSRQGESHETRLLWGLYRSRQTPDSSYRSIFPLWRKSNEEGKRAWSILGGLLGYRAEDGRRNLRLLYLLNVGSSAAETTEQ